MSDDNFDDELKLSPKEELAALKQRADMMGVAYHPSIGLEKLREKVNAAIVGAPKEEEPEQVVEQNVESETARRNRLKQEAAKLVRIRVTCMNPGKAEWEGEIFSVGNSVVGSFTKYVPFNAPDGWHVPHIIYEQLINRQCQVFQTVSDSRGNKVRKGKLIKEFSVEVLPQLTAEELRELAQRQALSKSID
jgi:hypothetical protein